MKELVFSRGSLKNKKTSQEKYYSEQHLPYAQVAARAGMWRRALCAQPAGASMLPQTLALNPCLKVYKSQASSFLTLTITFTITFTFFFLQKSVQQIINCDFTF